MKQYVNEIIKITQDMEIRHEIHYFDSGAFMIDLWIKGDFYCVQLYNETYGISRVTHDNGFDAFPDSAHTEWASFKTELEELING